MSSAVVGIDVGSYSSYLSVARKGGLETLLNEYSDRCTNSCVAFTKKNRLIGLSAKTQLISNPKNSVAYFVPFVGKKYSDNFLQMELPYLYHKVAEFENSFVVEVQYLGKNTKLRPEQLIAMLVTKLKFLAEAELQMDVNQIVINVPACYTITERRSLAMGLKIAGVECLRIINDLSAVALLYNATRVQSLKQSKLVAFVDVGYTYFQASIVRFDKENFQVILEAAEANLGGREFDRVIFEYLRKIFIEKYSLDVRDSSKASIRLMSECEKIKKRLSANSSEFDVNIECIEKQIDVSAKIDREKFEKSSSTILNRMNAVLTNFLEQFNKISVGNKESISSVEIIGGSTRIPCVKSLIAKVFDQETHNTLNADEAVSRGCALQSAMINSNCVIRRIDYQNYCLYAISLDIYTVLTPESEFMALDVHQREKHRYDTIPIIKTGQAYPVLGASVELITDVTIIEIKYTDRNQIPNDNKVIGYLKINPAENSEIDRMTRWLLEYEINASGLFNVTGLTLKRYSKAIRPPCKSIPPLHNRQASPSPNKLGGLGGNFEVYGPVDFKIHYMMDFTNLQINNMIKKEKDYRNHDKEEVDRLNTKNHLEESIYKNREYLSDVIVKNKFPSATSDKTLTVEIDSTMSYLAQLETWLFEDGEDVDREQYTKKIEKMNELVKIFAQKLKNGGAMLNSQEELIGLITNALDVIGRVEKGINPNIKKSEYTSKVPKKNPPNLERLKQLVNQGNRMLKNFEVQQTHMEEYKKFISEFKALLEVMKQ